jgi:Zn-dependent protease
MSLLRHRFRLFTFLGRPLHVQTLLVIALCGAGFYDTRLLIAVIGYLAALMLRELARIAVMARADLDLGPVTLGPLGALVPVGTLPGERHAETLLCLTGPAITALLSGLCFLTAYAGWGGPWDRTLTILSDALFLVTVFHLLPAFPGDGGRLLRGQLL